MMKVFYYLDLFLGLFVEMIQPASYERERERESSCWQ
jgi:hypothetical protein